MALLLGVLYSGMVPFSAPASPPSSGLRPKRGMPVAMFLSVVRLAFGPVPHMGHVCGPATWLIPKRGMPVVLFLRVVRLAFGVFPHTGHVLGLDAIAGAATSG